MWWEGVAQGTLSSVSLRRASPVPASRGRGAVIMGGALLEVSRAPAGMRVTGAEDWGGFIPSCCSLLDVPDGWGKHLLPSPLVSSRSPGDKGQPLPPPSLVADAHHGDCPKLLCF